MPRILLLVTDLQLGGTPTVVRELALRLSPVTHVEVACLAEAGPVARQLVAAGITVTPLNAAGPFDVRILPRLLHLLRSHEIDTVFSFLIHANALAAAAWIFAPHLRWIQSIQTTQPHPRWHWILQRFIHHAAEVVVVPSPSVAEAAVHLAHIPADKIIIIPNAIDPGAFSASVVPTTKPVPYPITFLGRLDPIKDVPTLLRAVAILNPLVHLNIFGTGSDLPRVQHQMAADHLQELVTLHGSIDFPQAALAESGMLVLPSLAEGFGLVLIEAMAAGVPIVATHVPGICDVLRDNQTALLVAPGDPPALADAMRQLVEDPALRQRLITAAGVEVRQRFVWSIILPQYLKLLHPPLLP